MDVEDLIADLDEQQREAVLSDAAPLCVVAPPGSGKTRVLTRRIARRVTDGSAAEQHVLAITFTRRAAGELRRRLGELGLRNGAWTGTFHAVALRLLRQRDADLQRRPRALLGHRARLIEEVAGSAHASEAATEIDWASARQIEPASYAPEARRAGRHTATPAARIADTYAAYIAAKKERRLVDFDDLLRAMVHEIERDRAYAAALRWRLRHLFVDEFQDVNRLQHTFLEALRGDRPDFFVVGDPDQAIYSWNGADASWIADFTEHHPAATVLHLRTSHRSSPQVLALAAEVLGGGGPAPAASRPDGPSPRYHRAADDDAEAEVVRDLVREAHVPGRPWSSIAVLARTNAHLTRVAQMLLRDGIPVRRRSGAEGAAVLDELRVHAAGAPVRRWLLDRDEPLPASVAVAVDDALAQDPDLDVAGLRATLGVEGSAGGDGVALTTFHAAKGLEWPVVVVAGAKRGLVPHAAATTAAAREEERRLLYVAITRAQREAHITWAGAEADRSPFLPDAPESEAAPPPPRDRPAAAPVDPVLHTLRTWRRHAARAARVHEQLVCTDDELARLAARRPATVEDVAAVLGSMSARRLAPRMLAALRQAGHA